MPLKGTIVHTKIFPFEKKLFRIVGPLSFIPGQFVEVSLPGIGECPISITSPPFESGMFEICIKKIGRATSYLYNMGEGCVIGYRGPFGNGFPIDKVKDCHVAVVAGGLGILPLRSFIKQALMTHWCSELTILYGAREPDDMLFKEELQQWKRDATVIDVCERGSERTGFVSDFIKCISISGDEVVFMCGPPAMFRPVGERLIAAGIDSNNIFVSLERRMKCGIGTCGHCVVDGSWYVCSDGPVVPYTKCIRGAWEHSI